MQRSFAVTLQRQTAKRQPTDSATIKIFNFMTTQTTNATRKGNTESKNAAKQVNNANATRRVVETRDMWEVIYNHLVTLVVAYTRGQKPAEPRKGFGFGAIADQPHSRAYAQSLLVGFLTGKAGKALKGCDDLASRESREKIAIAILLDTKLAKDGNEGAKRIMAKSEPKREKAFAEAVLKELSKPQTETPTPNGGSDTTEQPKTDASKEAKGKGKKSETKTTAPKGGKAKSADTPATKGGKKSANKPAAK